MMLEKAENVRSCTLPFGDHTRKSSWKLWEDIKPYTIHECSRILVSRSDK